MNTYLLPAQYALDFCLIKTFINVDGYMQVCLLMTIFVFENWVMNLDHIVLKKKPSDQWSG